LDTLPAAHPFYITNAAVSNTAPTAITGVVSTTAHFGAGASVTVGATTPAGTYTYFCLNHNWIKGTLIVGSGASALVSSVYVAGLAIFAAIFASKSL